MAAASSSLSLTGNLNAGQDRVAAISSTRSLRRNLGADHVSPRSPRVEIPTEIIRKLEEQNAVLLEQMEHLLTVPQEKKNLEIKTLEQSLQTWQDRAEGRKKVNRKIALLKIVHSFYGEATTLSLKGFVLGSLPAALGQLKHLTKLELINLNIDQIPKEIGSLSQLTELDISSNQIQSLTSQIGKLKGLEILSAKNNLLDGLPNTITNLTNLKILDLASNKFTAFPISSEFILLSKFGIINLDNNQLKSIPDDILGIPHGVCILLSGNRFSDDLIESYATHLHDQKDPPKPIFCISGVWYH